MAARRGAGVARARPAKRQAPRTPSRPAAKPAAAADSGVDAFVAALDHPLEVELRLVRAALLALDPSLGEAVKWNSVSFRNEADFFATVHLRSRASLQLVLHTGVERKPTAETGVPVDDPAGLIERWLAKDRCLVSLGADAALRANLAPLAVLVRSWLRSV